MKFYVVCHTVYDLAGSYIYVCQKIRTIEADNKPSDYAQQDDLGTTFLTYFDSLNDAEKYRDMLIGFRDYYRNMSLLNKCCGSLGVNDI